ncbi:MAG: hypothetical protein HOA17_03015 [Candidatus Melainabacteria bacterium]|jgi:hypothetical protein|nr:hypothetical protein [Candidatus Melainabacteria bacterium]
MDPSDNLEQHGEKSVANLNTELDKLSHSFGLPRFLHLVLATVVVIGIFYLVKFIFNKLTQYTENLKKQYLKPISFRTITLVSQHNLAAS